MIKLSQLKLVDFFDPILNRPPEEFNFNGELDPGMLSNILIEKMKMLGGVGLSANQLGLNIKMFVMGIEDKVFTCINPSIISVSKQEIVMEEGCLSIPGVFLKIKRPEQIVVSFYNSKQEKKEESFSGLTARIFLHEYDHMMGKTMKDNVSRLKWDLSLKKYKHLKDKLVKKHVQQKLLEIKRDVEHSSRVS